MNNQAGLLRHRIQIQEKQVSRDEFNAEVITWILKYHAWASIEPLNGREFFEARMIQAEITHRITIRYRPDITPEMRLEFNGRYFDIESVRNIREIGNTTIIMARENPHE